MKLKTGLLIGVGVLQVWIVVGCATLPRGRSQVRPPEAFFTNVADDVGLGGIAAKRVLWIDLDGDTYADCILGNKGVFLNRPGGGGRQNRVFVDFTEASNLYDGGRRVIDVFQAADIDNDGDIDLFAGKDCDFERPKVVDDEPVVDEAGRPVMAVLDDGRRSEILLNDGSGRFTAASTGFIQPNRPERTTTATFLDYDNDGFADLFIGNWYRQYGLSYECYPSRLFRNLAGESLVDVTEDAGLMTVAKHGLRHSSRPVYGTAHCDFNNDGLQDIVVCAYGRQWNMLYKNHGDGTFVDVADAVGFDGDAERTGIYPEDVDREKELPFRANGNTFDAACADYDNDGDIDIFLAEITHQWAGESSDLSTLLVNLGAAGGYRLERRLDLGIDRRRVSGRWNQGDLYAAWIDFDNDGLQDLLISSGDYPDGQFLRLFRQSPDHKFVDVTGAAGFAWEGSGSLSLADYDHDGDVDILVLRGNVRLPAARASAMPPRIALFRNNVGQDNNWVAIRLVGSGAGGSNRNAIGARVIVTAGDLVQTREVYGGLGHNSHRNEFTLTFGLGKHDRIDRIEVRWPNKEHTVSTRRDVPVNRAIAIQEPRVR